VGRDILNATTVSDTNGTANSANSTTKKENGLDDHDDSEDDDKDAGEGVAVDGGLTETFLARPQESV
jgi:hypothetical protein